jgi:hypothetical protein
MTVSLTLTFVELAALIGIAVGLAATDAAAISRLAIAWVAKKAGIEPGEIMQYNNATNE